VGWGGAMSDAPSRFLQLLRDGKAKCKELGHSESMTPHFNGLGWLHWRCNRCGGLVKAEKLDNE
jgi:hypothetical protein